MATVITVMRTSPSPASTKNDSYKQGLLSNVSPSATSFRSAPLSPSVHTVIVPDYPLRPTRRNTTGSAPTTTPRKPSPGSHSKGISQPNVVHDDTTLGEGGSEGGSELANDIELHAERIRQERISKRAKQQQQAEAEAALTQKSIPATTAQEMPLVGNLIGEDHVNYVLMYNMLTGIRIGVCLFILSDSGLI